MTGLWWFLAGFGAAVGLWICVLIAPIGDGYRPGAGDLTGCPNPECIFVAHDGPCSKTKRRSRGTGSFGPGYDRGRHVPKDWQGGPL